MMRAKQRRFLVTLLILGLLISKGSIQNRDFIPLISGGGGIKSDLLSPYTLADPVLYNTVQDNLQSDGESDKKAAINDFISLVADGATGVIRGVYSENNFALKII